MKNNILLFISIFILAFMGISKSIAQNTGGENIHELCMKLCDAGWDAGKKGDYNEEKRYGDKALDMAKKNNFKDCMPSAYDDIAAALNHLGNIPGALENAKSALRIREEMHDTIGIATSYNNIGNIYLSDGNDSLANINYVNSYNTIKKGADKYAKAIILHKDRKSV